MVNGGRTIRSSSGNIPPSSTNPLPRMPIRPHSQSSPLPRQTPQQQISPRRGSEPLLRTVAYPSLGTPTSTPQASEHGRSSTIRNQVATRPSLPNGPRSMQRPGLDPLQRRRPYPSAQTSAVVQCGPPYPLTPPSTPHPVHLPQHGSSFPTPWFHAPMPPHRSLITDSAHANRPERPPLTWKHCLSRLDDSLKKLSIVTSLWLLSFVISLCIFIRSLTSGTSHLPASRTALLIWFCVSAAGLSIFFSLVLEVLCRRARRTPLSLSENHRVRNHDIEMQNLQESRTYRFAMAACSRDIRGRRNAVSGPSDGREHRPSSGLRHDGTSQRIPVRTSERIVKRTNALPVRVDLAQLPKALPGRVGPPPRPRPLPMPPRRSSKRLQFRQPPIRSSVEDNPDHAIFSTRSLLSGFKRSADESRSRVHSALVRTNSNISPGKRIKTRPDSPRPRDAFLIPSHICPRYIRITGIHEHQTHLQPPSSTTAKRGPSIQSIRASPGVYRDDTDAQSLESDHGSTQGSQVRTASAMSLRSAGKAREYFVRASPGASTVLSTAHTRVISPETRTPELERRRASSPTINASQALVQAPSRTPMPLTSKPDAINKNISSKPFSAVRARSSRTSSPKKVPKTSRNDRSRMIGLGITVAGEEKENVAPEMPVRESGESDEVDAWTPVLPFESA